MIRDGAVLQALAGIDLAAPTVQYVNGRYVAWFARGDGAWINWVNRWTAEEGRHAIVLRDYLVVTRNIDLSVGSILGITAFATGVMFADHGIGTEDIALMLDRYMDFLRLTADWVWESDATLNFTMVSQRVTNALDRPPQAQPARLGGQVGVAPRRHRRRRHRVWAGRGAESVRGDCPTTSLDVTTDGAGGRAGQPEPGVCESPRQQGLAGDRRHARRALRPAFGRAPARSGCYARFPEWRSHRGGRRRRRGEHVRLVLGRIGGGAQQAVGVDLSLGQQITVVLVLMLTSKGVAGVPRAALVILAATVASVNLPLAGVALVLGVDALMDMGRTATNVLGNAIATSVSTGALKPRVALAMDTDELSPCDLCGGQYEIERRRPLPDVASE